MNTKGILQICKLGLLGSLLLVPFGCVEYVRVPLAVPLPAVGGARPAGPQGIHLLAEFGDGVWGQEQERAEMAGLGISVSFLDRGEATWSNYASTRQVRDSTGNAHSGELTRSVLGKLRIWDFREGQVSVGVHVARMHGRRTQGRVQNEEITAWDVALPVELYRLPWNLGLDRMGVYAAPRVVLEAFYDRQTEITRAGTMMGGLAGISGRWRYVALAGELNVLNRPSIDYQGVPSGSGWILLPMGSVRFILPIGR